MTTAMYRKLTIRELRTRDANMSREQALRTGAETGETVLVTDRDRVVAELGPPRAGRSPLLADAALAEAVRQGWLTPPTLPTGTVPPRLPAVPFDELMRDLDEDRNAR